MRSANDILDLVFCVIVGHVLDSSKPISLIYELKTKMVIPFVGITPP